MDFSQLVLIYTAITLFMMGFGVGRLVMYFMPGVLNEEANRRNLIAGILIPGIWLAFFPIMAFSIAESFVSQTYSQKVTLELILDCLFAIRFRDYGPLFMGAIIAGSAVGSVYGIQIRQKPIQEGIDGEDADKLEEMMAACEDCEIVTCAYNRYLECRLPFVADRSPDIDENGNCKDYVISTK